MRSEVYFADIRTRKHADSKVAKIGRLCDAVGLRDMIGKDMLVAIKLHFGELGNDTHLNPTFAREVSKKITEAGGKPFLTDTSTMYGGARHNAVDHLNTAYAHGFSPATVLAPVIIADGITGMNDYPVQVDLKHFKEVHIGKEIAAAPAMVVLSHFKGHEMAGFGGAIKNLAMGCASIRGKRAQHNDKVEVNQERCIACRMCVKVCPQRAVTLQETSKGPKAVVDKGKCVGCYECITVCEPKAVAQEPGSSLTAFVERIAEYAYGAVKNKTEKVRYLNFILDVTPDCDCVSWSDAPLVPNIGILASRDPVALDKACYDLVSKAQSLSQPDAGPGADKFKLRWPQTDGLTQIAYGAQIGLGSMDYELINI